MVKSKSLDVTTEMKLIKSKTIEKYRHKDAIPNTITVNEKINKNEESKLLKEIINRDRMLHEGTAFGSYRELFNSLFYIELNKLKKFHIKDLCKLNLITKTWQMNSNTAHKFIDCVEKEKDVDKIYKNFMKLKKENDYKFYAIFCCRKRDKLCYTEIYKNDRKIIGYVVFRPDKPIENRRSYIEYYIDTEFRNCGAGTKMMEQIRNIAKDNLKLHKILADPASVNTASIKLLEKTGWSFVGELKAHERYLFEEKWDDIRLYEYLLE